MNTTHTTLRKSVALLTVLAMTLMAFGAFFAQSASAAGLTGMGITDNADFTSNSIALDTTTTAATVIAFTTITDLNQDAQSVSFELQGYTAAALVVGDLGFACDVNGDNDVITLEAAAGTADNGAAEVTITGTADPVIDIVLDSNSGAAPDCGAGDAELTIALGELVSSGGAADAAGNYPIYITTTHDNGAFLTYISDENDVQIEADVDNVLTFVIRNTGDTADQANVDALGVGPNLCDLGNLTTAGVQSCSYRLKVTTNANSGYYVTVTLDDDLNNSSDTEFIDNIATGAAPQSGTEGYNITFDAGLSSTLATVTECDGTSPTGDCNASGVDFSDATGIAFGPSAHAGYLTGAVMYDVDGPNSPSASNDTTNTALVTHYAEADSGTPAGTYTQLATYTVTAVW